MSVSNLTKEECARIMSLYEMTSRAAKEDADEFTQREAENAAGALFRLLAKHGLNFGDIPEIQRQHAGHEAAKADAAAAPPDTNNQPHALELVHHILREWIDVQEHEYVGIALWILHTHVFEHFAVTPRLALLSPVNGCGKSNVLRVAEHLTPNAAYFEDISAADLKLLLDEGHTMLLDEGDNAGLRVDDTMRLVLNGGYERGRSGRVMSGRHHERSAFGPLAFATIGTLPRPLTTRSIVVMMHRSKRTDLKTKQHLRMTAEMKRLEGVRRLIVAWAQNNPTFSSTPKLPKILRHRMADNWRVLLAIADSFGSAYWSKAARDAAEAFAVGYSDEDAPISLLYDIRTIFIRRHIDRIKSRDLTQELHQLEDGEGVWSAWTGEREERPPHPITQGEVAMLLRRFSRTELRARPLFSLSRHSGGVAARGYYRSQFEPWFEGYCPEGSEAEVVRQLRPEAKG